MSTHFGVELNCNQDPIKKAPRVVAQKNIPLPPLSDFSLSPVLRKD